MRSRHGGGGVLGKALAALLVLAVVVADLDSNHWVLYYDTPCCVHDRQVRHHKDHVRTFSCGRLFYRSMYLDEERDALFLGAMDRVFRLNLSNISHSHCERDSLLLEPTNVANCVSKGKSEHFDCRNHIRVLQPVDNGRRLYVCGTNAHSPRDWVINWNLTHLSRQQFVPGVGQGAAKCPYDPADNSTALWVRDGNPGGLPGLYSGTNAEFTKADTVIFRSDLHNATTGRREFTFKRTLKYDSKWLDKPNFVGSFDVGEYVLFFFRETAVEYINCGKAVYSRVARVCKRDTGGKNILAHNWATYLKARLNCSLPGEFPFYFNEIQSVYRPSSDPDRFYGVFTTSSYGLTGSAICGFTLQDIQEAFRGKFKEQATSTSAWLPVLTSKVPEPRPGECVNNTESLPDTVLNFIRSHPLMDSAVSHEHGRPVFYTRETTFTRLAVHLVRQQRLYHVFYAGTGVQDRAVGRRVQGLRAARRLGGDEGGRGAAARPLGATPVAVRRVRLPRNADRAGAVLPPPLELPALRARPLLRVGQRRAFLQAVRCLRRSATGRGGRPAADLRRGRGPEAAQPDVGAVRTRELLRLAAAERAERAPPRRTQPVLRAARPAAAARVDAPRPAALPPAGQAGRDGGPRARHPGRDGAGRGPLRLPAGRASALLLQPHRQHGALRRPGAGLPQGVRGVVPPAQQVQGGPAGLGAAAGAMRRGTQRWRAEEQRDKPRQPICVTWRDESCRALLA